jgi:hypothetical protein
LRPAVSTPNNQLSLCIKHALSDRRVGSLRREASLTLWVWDRLGADGIARFRFPPHGRIPNFAGAGVTATRLLDIERERAHSRQVNPDSPHVPVHISGHILPNYATIDRDDHVDFWHDVVEAVPKLWSLRHSLFTPLCGPRPDIRLSRSGAKRAN